MPYKDKTKQQLYYYKNREKRILYQREYDKKNKDKKRDQDKKRYGTKKYNHIQNIRHHSQQKHFPTLIKKYKGCQICNSQENLEIHHKKYTKKIEDCLLLCQSCHKKMHRKVFKD